MYSHSPDYLKIFLQVLGGILLIAMIFIAWEVWNWLNKQNTDQTQNPTPATEVVQQTPKTDPTAPPVSVIKPLEQKAVAQEETEQNKDYTPVSIFEDPIDTEQPPTTPEIKQVEQATVAPPAVEQATEPTAEPETPVAANEKAEEAAKVIEAAPEATVDTKENAIQPLETPEITEPVVEAVETTEEVAESAPASVETPQDMITEPEVEKPAQGLEALVQSSIAQIQDTQEKEFVQAVAKAEKDTSKKEKEAELRKAASEKIDDNQAEDIDVYNKVVAKETATPSGSVQDQLNLLVRYSMQQIKNEKEGEEAAAEKQQAADAEATTTEPEENAAATTQTATPAEATTAESDEYISGLNKEVKTRQNEMRTITVRKGDTLGKIARRAYGSSSKYMKIYEANPQILANPHRLKIGQVLRVPE